MIKNGDSMGRATNVIKRSKNRLTYLLYILFHKYFLCAVKEEAV